VIVDVLEVEEVCFLTWCDCAGVLAESVGQDVRHVSYCPGLRD